MCVSNFKKSLTHCIRNPTLHYHIASIQHPITLPYYIQHFIDIASDLANPDLFLRVKKSILKDAISHIITKFAETLIMSVEIKE